MKEKILQSVLAIFCGVLCFIIDFLIIPKIYGVEDIIWGTLMVIVPVVPAVLLFEKLKQCHLRCVFLSAFVQYVLLWVFVRPLSKYLGCSIEFALGDFEYIGMVFCWPIAGALAQLVVIALMRYLKKKGTWNDTRTEES